MADKSDSAEGAYIRGDGTNTKSGHDFKVGDFDLLHFVLEDK